MRDELGYLCPVGAGLNMPGYCGVVVYNAYLEKRCPSRVDVLGCGAQQPRRQERTGAFGQGLQGATLYLDILDWVTLMHPDRSTPEH